MAQNLNQVPPNMEVWEVDGKHFLIKFVPKTNPPIPLAWFVSSSADRRALGITKADRTMTWAEFTKSGALRHGDSRELLNTTEDPFDQILSNFEAQAKVKPWLADPEVMAVWASAAMEGRKDITAELQGTEWWRTHSDSERSWLTLNAADPATANRMIDDNRSQVADLFKQAGVGNASQNLIDTVADNWTTGKWSQVYATNQIRKLADPNLQTKLDPVFKGDLTKDLDTTQERVEDVRSLAATWLGPAYSMSDKDVEKWASRMREEPDARDNLVESLRAQRMALFPEYKDQNLTYEDIASPWRGVWSQVWGQTADETSPLFTKIVRMNDIDQATGLLRKEGLSRNVGKVVNDALSAVGGAFGGQVRRADPAIQ